MLTESKLVKILEDILCEKIEKLDNSIPLREQLEIDSIDLLDLLAKLRKDYGVKVEPSDIAHLRSINDILKFFKDNQ